MARFAFNCTKLARATHTHTSDESKSRRDVLYGVTNERANERTSVLNMLVDANVCVCVCVQKYTYL